MSDKPLYFSDLSTGASSRTKRSSAAVFFGEPVAHGDVSTGGADHLPLSVETLSFYPDLSSEALRVEHKRLYVILQNRGLIAS